MAYSLTCDNCGKEIETPSDRGQVTLPSDGTQAGTSVDLCRLCMESILADDGVQQAAANQRQRQAAIAAAHPLPLPSTL